MSHDISDINTGKPEEEAWKLQPHNQICPRITLTMEVYVLFK